MDQTSEQPAQGPTADPNPAEDDQSQHPLARLLDDAAHDRFPPPDETVEVLTSPPGPTNAVVGFTAHHVVAAPLDPDEVHARLPPGDLCAPLGPSFLGWVSARLGREAGCLDVVLASVEAEPSDLELIPRDDLWNHPRVARALRYREGLDVHTDPAGRGVVVIGRGLAGRREVSIEVDPAHRGRGLGVALARAARSLSPEPLFAQVAPGNVPSLRAFLAAGYRPIGSEVLFLKRVPGRETTI